MRLRLTAINAAFSAVLLLFTALLGPAASADTDLLPSTPNKPYFTETGTTGFVVNWTIPAGPINWQSWAVEFSEDGVTWPISGRVTCTGQTAAACGTSMRVTEVLEDSTFFVRVALISIPALVAHQKACADCSEGYSNWSSVSRVTTRNTYTTVPTSLRFKGTPGPYNFGVQWTEPHWNPRFALLQYDVQYRKKGASRWIDAGGDEYPSFTFGYILRLNTTYEMRVRSQYVDAGGDALASKWSDVKTFATNRTGPPSYILDGTTKVVKKHKDPISGHTLLDAQFKWTQPLDNGGSPITRYEFRIRNGVSPDWQQVYNTKLARTLTLKDFDCSVDPVTGPKWVIWYIAINAYNKYGTLSFNTAQFGVYTDHPANKTFRGRSGTSPARDVRCTITQIY